MRGFPFATLGLIGLSLLVFFFEHPGSVAQWGFVPRGGPVYTLVTYAFLHRDIWHLLGNMLTFYVIGVHVEEALGAIHYLLAFLSAAIVAGLVHGVLIVLFFAHEAHHPLIGASGAVFGILGLFAVRYWRTHVRLLWVPSVPAVVAVGIVMLMQLYLAIRSFRDGERDIAYIAHLAGFVYGFVLAFPLKVLNQSVREYGLEDAQRALGQGDLATAARYYRELLVQSPQDGPLTHTLALIQVRLGQEEAAHRYFTQALDLYSRQSNAPAVARVFSDASACLSQVSLPSRLLLRVAGACEEVEQFSIAQQVLSGLCRDFPHTADAELGLLKLGKLHLQRLRQPENAIAIFTEFLRLYPNSEWANHARGLLAEANHEHAH